MTFYLYKETKHTHMCQYTSHEVPRCIDIPESDSWVFSVAYVTPAPQTRVSSIWTGQCTWPADRTANKLSATTVPEPEMMTRLTTATWHTTLHCTVCFMWLFVWIKGVYNTCRKPSTSIPIHLNDTFWFRNPWSMLFEICQCSSWAWTFWPVKNLFRILYTCIFIFSCNTVYY